MPIRIAIIGGSLAGTTLANALLKHPNAANLHFDIFEAKSTFSERGASISLAGNAITAFKAMGLDYEAMFAEAGAVKVGSALATAAQGPHKGQTLVELPSQGFMVDREHYLNVLLKPIPKDRLHANKKLASIESQSPNGPYELRFEDNTTHIADAVIGCDGIRSKIRQIVLGPEHKEYWTPQFGGFWDARGRIAPQKAAELFGAELFNPEAPNELALVGKGALLLFQPTDGGRVYHVVVSAIASPDFDITAWKTQLTREFLEEQYQDWDDKFRMGVIESMMADDSGPGVVFTQWESPGTPFYNRGGICVVGDGAHATLPWMAQGGCLSTEDAAVMAALLGSLKDRSDVPAAMEAFDHVRRERAEAVILQSREAAKLLSGQLSMDPEEVARINPKKWWMHIWAHDLEKDIKEGIGHCSASRSQ